MDSTIRCARWALTAMKPILCPKYVIMVANKMNTIYGMTFDARELYRRLNCVYTIAGKPVTGSYSNAQSHRHNLHTPGTVPLHRRRALTHANTHTHNICSRINRANEYAINSVAIPSTAHHPTSMATAEAAAAPSVAAKQCPKYER